MWQFEFVWTVQTKDHSIIKLLILHFEKLFFRSLLRSNGHHRVNTRKIGAVQPMIVTYCNAWTTLHTSRTSISTHDKVSQHTMSIEHMNNRWIRTHSQEHIIKTWEEPLLLNPYWLLCSLCEAQGSGRNFTFHLQLKRQLHTLLLYNYKTQTFTIWLVNWNQQLPNKDHRHLMKCIHCELYKVREILKI
jgi:hypothetical protein